MASLYKRDRSAFWWIEYIDAAGARRQESTKLRHVLPGESRRATQLRNDLTARELAARSTTGSGLAEVWAAWVPRFIAQRYTGNEATRMRAFQAWHNLAAFLDEKDLTVPRQLQRQHIREFIEWRQIGHAERHAHKGAKNTALLEIKFLALILDEAIASGFCNFNPCHRLGIGRDKPKLKPAITMLEHLAIVKALEREPEWMQIWSQIAWEQGCRFSETMINLCDVDLSRDVLRLRTKGNKERPAEVPLSPRLRPLFARMIQDKRESTVEKSAIAAGGSSRQSLAQIFRQGRAQTPEFSLHEG